MALPTVVAVGTVANGIGDITPALPSGWAQNDIFLAVLECRAAEAIVVPSGWAHVTGSPVAHVGSDTEVTVAWKRAGSSESAPTFTDPGNHQVGRIIAIRGCPTSGDPWNVIATSSAASSTAVSIPGATTTVADCLVVAAVATGFDVASTTEISGWTNASLANLTEVIDNWTSDGNGGGIGVATGEKATAGAYSATTATIVNAAGQGCLSIALKPSTGTTHTLTPSDTVTASDAVGKASGKTAGDTLTASDMIAKAAAVARADGLSASDALAKALGVALADSLTLSDLLALAEGFYLSLSDTVTASDEFTRAWAAHRGLADTVTLAEALSKATGRSLADSLALVDERTVATGVEMSAPWFLGPIDMDPLGFSSSIDLTR